MANNKLVKVIGVVGPAIGLAVSLMNNWASNKETEETIAKKVAEALAQQAKES